MINFLKELYYGRLNSKDMLWVYGVLPLLFIFLINNMEIFSQKIGVLIAWMISIFSFIAWSGIKKSTTDTLLSFVSSILRFILFIVIVFAGPMAMIFGFSEYQG